MQQRHVPAQDCIHKANILRQKGFVHMHQGVAVLETRHGMSDDKETQKNPIKTSRKQGETNKNKYKYGFLQTPAKKRRNQPTETLYYRIGNIGATNRKYVEYLSRKTYKLCGSPLVDASSEHVTCQWGCGGRASRARRAASDGRGKKRENFVEARVICDYVPR